MSTDTKIEIHVCPEMENTSTPFRFKGKCPIQTCQYCNNRTKSGCLAMDRKESADKGISPKEIIFYKSSVFEELSSLDQKQAEALVRKAQGRARATIALCFYMRELDTESLSRDFQYEPNRSHMIDTVHNYLAQTFTEFRDWMLPYLADEDRFDDATKTFHHADVNLGAALRLPPKKFQTFCSAINYMATQTA